MRPLRLLQLATGLLLLPLVLAGAIVLGTLVGSAAGGLVTLLQMWGWLRGFLLALGAFVLGLGWLTNGLRLP